MNPQDKIMADFHRLVSRQNIKSEEELKQFLTSLTGKRIPDFSEEELTKEEQAQDLVFAAYKLPPLQGKAQIEEALRLNPNCIEAYEYLASIDRSVKNAMSYYEKGIAIGRQIFGGAYLEENRGRFWKCHETRPFMRCLQDYANCFSLLGRLEESVDILEEMIELNPEDNQGVRHTLMIYLIKLDETERFLLYEKEYEKDWSAGPFFNRALFAFKTEGESENANQKLKKAIEKNKFIPLWLLSERRLSNPPNYYTPGDENEADEYAIFARPIWKTIKGAPAWLKKIATQKA